MTTTDSGLAVFLTHRARLVAYAAPIVGCRAAAEDVVQEAYLRFTQASEHRSGFPSIRAPATYLFRIVRNLAMDWIKHLGPQQPGEIEQDELLNMPGSIPTPEHDALYRERLQIVARALAELPLRTRIAFEMHRLGGCTLQHTAMELGISVTLAHQLIHRALAHCVERLDDTK
jgi:RNA polymerase sigma factor (sigma-70 family)